MNPLLEIRDVSLSYHTVSGETRALSHISFHLLPGEFLAVVGPSGCGKIHAFEPDLRSSSNRKRYDSYERYASASRRSPHRIYAPEGSSSGMEDNLSKCYSRP